MRYCRGGAFSGAGRFQGLIKSATLTPDPSIWSSSSPFTLLKLISIHSLSRSLPGTTWLSISNARSTCLKKFRVRRFSQSNHGVQPCGVQTHGSFITRFNTAHVYHLIERFPVIRPPPRSTNSYDCCSKTSGRVSRRVSDFRSAIQW